MIQIWTFPADPSTERVPSLAERVAYLRHPINLRLFNWRVPALLNTRLQRFPPDGDVKTHFRIHAEPLLASFDNDNNFSGWFLHVLNILMQKSKHLKGQLGPCHVTFLDQRRSVGILCQ